MSSSKRHNMDELFLLSVMLFLLCAIVCSSHLAGEIDLRLRDGYVRLQPRSQPPPEIALVLIDDRSLQEYGRWPWSREVLAQLIRNVNRSNPRVVGVDILLSEPQSKAADHALADALRLNDHTVLAAKIGSFPDGPRWLAPLPLFSQNAVVAHAQAVLDADGVCRRFPVQEVSTEGVRYAFGVELARHIVPEAASDYLHHFGIFPSTQAAVTVARPTLIPIAYRNTEFLTISAVDALRRERLPELTGRAVLIGFGPSEISDRLTTPLGGPLPSPGVEINAHILNDVLHGFRVREVSQWWSLAFLLIVAPLLVFCFRKVRGWQSPLIAIALAFGTYSCGYLLYHHVSLSISPLPLVTGAVLAPLIVYAADFKTAERRLSAQLREMQGWLDRTPSTTASTETTDIFGQLTALGNLQAQVGSLYELHDRLLESADNAVMVFDSEGTLLLQNHQATNLFPQPDTSITLAALEKQFNISTRGSGDSRHEVTLNGELYGIRVSSLPSVTLAKAGGTVITLSSLRMRVERDRARAEAIRFVTHELRTPIVAIQGFAELMLQIPGSPACANAPEIIFRESQRLVVLINSYLDVLRIESGSAVLRRESVDFNELVIRTIELLQPLAQAAHMKVVLNQHTCSCISGDRTLITGAVLNLVSNAIKYGRSGTEVEITSDCKDSTVILTVYNQCSPVPEHELQALFDLNYRSSTQSSQKHGWGIGLTFVKRIAENHGGSVHAENVRDGIRFELRFPSEAVGVTVAQTMDAHET